MLNWYWFENRIWAIGGYSTGYTTIVESYDPTTNSWQSEASLTTARHFPFVWSVNGRIYVGGGYGNSFLNSVEVYDTTAKLWSHSGNLPGLLIQLPWTTRSMSSQAQPHQASIPTKSTPPI